MGFDVLLLMCSLAWQPDVDTLLVCPPPLQGAMRPWIEYRQKQGRRIELLAPPSTAAALRSTIRDRAKRLTKLRWLLLVGDAGNGNAQTPVDLVDARVNVYFGSERQIATDNSFADLDGDEVPDIAVGRLPADNADELALMVNKILRYEQATPGQWCRQVNFVAGVGGFGWIDSVIEMVTRKFLTEGIPPGFCTSMTYGSWKSVFCPSPASFHAAAVERLNEGCLFWVYIGHGQRHLLDRIRVPTGDHHILGVRDMGQLRSRQGAPIAIFLACYTGAFDDPRDCLAEEMLRTRGGPVAVLSGSRVTMPYAMGILGNGLMHEYFVARRATLGEVVMHAKQQLAAPSSDPSGPLGKNRQLLDMVAAAVSPKPGLIGLERLEHLSLFNLLGDPLLRLPHPRPMQVQSEQQQATAGRLFAIRGQSQLRGPMRLELVGRRDRNKHPAPSRRRYDESPAAQQAYNADYAKANDRVWFAGDYDFRGGPFQLSIPVPTGCRGPCVIRAFVRGSTQMAIGACEIFVRPAPLGEQPARAGTGSISDE